MEKSVTEQIREALRAPRMPRRIAMTVVGVCLSGVAAGIFKAAALGIDPFQVLCAGLDAVIPIPFGTLYVLINLVLLVAMFLVDRHYIGLGTLVNLFLLGYIIQFVQWGIGVLLPEPSLWVRLGLLILAVPILCFASALYFTADLGVSTYDVWALVLDKRTKAPFRFLRIGTDLLCVGVGFCLLGFRTVGMIGIGTILTALFMGPLIDWLNRVVARPMLYGKDGEMK
jgi:uncharacterized membrane protein YczE